MKINLLSPMLRFILRDCQNRQVEIHIRTIPSWNDFVSSSVLLNKLKIHIRTILVLFILENITPMNSRNHNLLRYVSCNPLSAVSRDDFLINHIFRMKKEEGNMGWFFIISLLLGWDLILGLFYFNFFDTLKRKYHDSNLESDFITPYFLSQSDAS